MEMFSLRHKIAQMLVVGFSGERIQDQDEIGIALREEGIGGVILFDYDLERDCWGKNLVNINQIRKLTDSIRHQASQSFCGQQGFIPFIAIDYEGGVVDRLAKITGIPATLQPKDLAQLDKTSFEIRVREMANTLYSLGFNLNFAPVVDLAINNEEGIIGALGRCFSNDPIMVARLAQQFSLLFKEKKIFCCYKHFPGHGSVGSDTHFERVDASTYFKPEELVPYRVLFEKNSELDLVMTAHIINSYLEPELLPATFSYKILTELLRRELGFSGLVVSDDLQMKAISQYYSLATSLELSINAGVDILIFANQLEKIKPVHLIDTIEQLVLKGRIPLQRIEASFQRICHVKMSLSSSFCHT